MNSTQKDIATTKASEFPLLFLIVLLGLALRLLLLTASDFGIESDEAIVGLMAKHILEGAEWPIFYYGQHYMGSVEAFLTTASFYFFGASAASLKLVPFVFSALHIFAVYVLARRLVSLRYAQLAALFVAVGPSTLILWGAKARGGFIELVFIGTLCLILTGDLVARLLRTKKLPVFTTASLGLLAGLGWWMNNQIVFYLVPSAIVLLIYLLFNERFFLSLKLISLGLLSFILGGFPFWYANLFGDPRFATFTVLFGSTSEGKFFEYLGKYFDVALPIILGARRFWSTEDVFPGSTTIALSSAALVFLLFVFGLIRVFAEGRVFSSERFYRLLLLLTFIIVVPVIFAASSFGWLAMAPRYLLPLYSVFPVILAVALFQLRDLAPFLRKVLSCALLVPFAVIHLSSNYLGGVAVAGEPIVYQRSRVAHSHQELYAWLAKHSYTHINTNYWVGYRVALETNERISFSLFGEPYSLRIPEYEKRDLKENLPQVYVLVPSQTKELLAYLGQIGRTYRLSKVSGYDVVDKIEFLSPRGELVELKPEYLDSTQRPELLPEVIDGDLATRWASSMPQAKGMHIWLRLPQAELLSGLDIDLGSFASDYPRYLEVIGVEQDGKHRVLRQIEGRIHRGYELSFKPYLLKEIILVQQAKTQIFDWSIAELRLYKAETALLETSVPETEE